MARKLARGVECALPLVLAVHPEQFASRSVDRHAIAARPGSQEEPSLDQQRRRFELIFLARAQYIGLEAPRDLEVAEILGIDLIERRIARIGLVGRIMAPFGIRPTGQFLRHRAPNRGCPDGRGDRDGPAQQPASGDLEHRAFGPFPLSFPRCRMAAAYQLTAIYLASQYSSRP